MTQRKYSVEDGDVITEQMGHSEGIEVGNETLYQAKFKAGLQCLRTPNMNFWWLCIRMFSFG